MAHGNPELVELPLVYHTRTLKAGRKQAESNFVYEPGVYRLPSWNADEAPVIARVHTRSLERDVAQDTMVDVDYRAARGADGVVRMMAAIDSQAFDIPAMARHRALNPGVPPMAAVNQLWYPSLSHHAAHGIVSAGELGRNQVLFSEAGVARARMALLARSMVLVDGRLHMPCAEPGWYITQGHDTLADRARISAVTDNRTHGECTKFVPFRRDAREHIAATYQHMDNVLAVPGALAGITELVPSALEGDWMWARMRRVASLVVFNDDSVWSGLMEEEVAARRTLLQALCTWTSVRNPALVPLIVRTARAVHSERSNGNADMMGMVLQIAAAMERNPQAMPLQTRLELAGVDIAPLPAGEPIAGVAGMPR